MTNPVLNNNIATDSVILWQYDKAYNLIRLIQAWNEFAKVSCTDFWNYFGNSIFPIDRADTFGLNAWGNMLGIPRPTIRIEKGSDDRTDNITDPEWIEVDTSKKSEIENLISNGYILYRQDSDKTILYKPVEGFNIDGYSEDGYRVLDDGISDGEDSGYKTVTIRNTLYRGLLKGRFFMMCHAPTVPNYNKYLSIVFGAFDTENEGKIAYDIFDEYGNVKASSDSDSSDSGELPSRYVSRNRALDFQNMTMGFTFPKDATVEEAYLIFQHYDIVYQFPAGIRYPGEFIYDDLVIGLNKDQSKGQMYKNFVDGLVLADEPNPISNPNGGIFSETDRANYDVKAQANGKAHACYIPNGAKVTINVTPKNDLDASQRIPVWIDWGNGDAGYRYVINGYDDSYSIESSEYQSDGIYAVVVFYNDKDVASVDIGSEAAGFRPIEVYTICPA